MRNLDSKQQSILVMDETKRAAKVKIHTKCLKKHLQNNRPTVSSTSGAHFTTTQSP